MNEELRNLDTVVVKVGTSSILRVDNSLDREVMGSFVDDVAHEWRQDKLIVITTSGAVRLGMRKEGGNVQIAASRGQIELMQTYREMFKNYGIEVGQLLLTKKQFSSGGGVRKFVRDINIARNENTLMIANENDPITTEKTTLGDNDALSARIACKIGADALIMLSVENGTPGKGGGKSKAEAIAMVKSEGIRVFIVDGKKVHVVRDVFNGDRSGERNAEKVMALLRTETPTKARTPRKSTNSTMG